MNNNIFVPNLCKVGFNIRTDTYTGKLGYIIYKDNKNKWRKEPSWESWRHKEGSKYSIYKGYENGKYIYEEGIYDDSVAPIEFENIPTEGFVLNKKAGGYSTGWNHRATYCRVYDPRGFEFEISIPNLLYILDNTNSEVGKGLSGNFVYGWEGKDLILIPENAPEYKEMVSFTQLQSKKITTKDLILGATYRAKNNSELIYLGKYDVYNTTSDYEDYANKKYNRVYTTVNAGKQHWFKKGDSFISLKSLNSIGECVSEECVSNYAELIGEMETQKEYSPYDESKYQYELATDLDKHYSIDLSKLYSKNGKPVHYLNTGEYSIYQNTFSAIEQYEKKKESLNNSMLYYNNQSNFYWANHYSEKLKEVKIKSNYINIDSIKHIIPDDVKPYDWLVNCNLLYKQVKYLKNGKKASN